MQKLQSQDVILFRAQQIYIDLPISSAGIGHSQIFQYQYVFSDVQRY